MLYVGVACSGYFAGNQLLHPIWMCRVDFVSIPVL
jgi:hypothetical protein